MTDTITVATFQVLNSYMWLVATTLHRADIEHFNITERSIA